MLRRFREYALILVSSVLLVLPYHFGALWGLAFVAFVPAFFVLDGKNPGQAFKHSFLLGCFFYLLLGYWLTLVNVLGFLVMVLYLALYFGFFGMFSSYFFDASLDFHGTGSGKSIGAVFFVSAIWTVSEYLRGWIISGIPWAILAYTQWKNIPFIQISDLTGAWGVSFFIMAVNLLLFKLIKCFWAGKKEISEDRTKTLGRMRRAAALLLCLGGVVLLTTGYGFLSLKSRDAYYRTPEEKKRIRVSVVQGNIPQDQKWDARIKNIIFEKYKRLTFMSALEKSDLIVWPETSFPGFIEDEPVLAAQLRGIVRQSRTEVLVGAPALGNLEEGLRFYNSAILFGADGEEKKRYNKVHLVPFGEYIPFDAVFGILRNLFHIGRFSPGNEKTVFLTETRYQPKNLKVRFGVLICYEDIFPGLVRDFVRGGADFLINMTNDAWFGKTGAPYQHAQGSIFRAVENRVNIVRAANTGLSCFISPEGRILASVQDNGEEIFVTGHRGYDLILRKTPSFYTRFGDVFILIAFFLCCLAYRARPKKVSYSRI